MFDNVGSKIKAWAKVIFAINAISCLIGGIVFITIHPFNHWSVSVGDVFVGLFIIAIGLLLSWFASLWVYAYGENNENLKFIAAAAPGKTPKQSNPEPVKTTKPSRNLNLLGLSRD